MKKILLLINCALCIVHCASSQDTFSICAYDSVTRQVGSAGATCIAGTTSAIIISDVHPGVGVIHSQAYYIAANQNYGRTLMNLGTLTPQQIIDSLTLHDYQNDSTKRQYGIVDLVHHATAQWTGTNCDNYKNHIRGSYYSVQGNTLLGQQILDSIESRFVNTQGTLACRLMAALQGAKVVGADTRCAVYGISTFSAFLRVANATDVIPNYYLNLNVNTYPNHIEPIDSLQHNFDLWGGCNAVYVPSLTKRGGIKIFPNPSTGVVMIAADGLNDIREIKILTLLGDVVKTIEVKNDVEFTFSLGSLAQGVYFLRAESESGEFFTSKLVRE